MPATSSETRSRAADATWVRGVVDRYEGPLVLYASRLTHNVERARDVVQTHATDLDQGEEISVSEYSISDIRKAIETGRMINALALLALSRVFDLRTP